jgi:hypothetical protein
MGVRVRLGSLLRETNNSRFARRIGTDKRSCGHLSDCLDRPLNENYV